MKKVVLDTNALFYPFQFQVSLEEEIRALVGACDIVVPRVVLKELMKLRDQGKDKNRKLAAAALKYAERFEVLKGPPGEIGDTSILAAAVEVGAEGGEGSILVTSDRELIDRAKAKGLRVIFLRGKQRLELK